MSDTRHRPARPTWTCSGCGQPWPCPERRRIFLEDFQGRRMQLRGVLALFLIDATEDLADPVEQLHERFVSWAYRR
ncbi:flavin reductase [Dactylosporangium sp. CA-152071]|uniref:flavin reductase n=1 Tax=Dactylosporangium sp. CA-152071 TaxID=3239933 RepID=UPI003D929C26